jgi:hypothetical protein
VKTWFQNLVSISTCVPLHDGGAAGAVAVGRAAAKCVAAVCASVGPAATASTAGLYTLNPVATHSLKPPGFNP